MAEPQGCDCFTAKVKMKFAWEEAEAFKHIGACVRGWIHRPAIEGCPHLPTAELNWKNNGTASEMVQKWTANIGLDVLSFPFLYTINNFY